MQDTDPIGNVKATRADWLAAAMEALIAQGVEGVKIQVLGAQLGVSRSSFYWYFKSRQHLLDALLEHWETTNTTALVGMAEKPAATITESVGNVFKCAINPELFDTRLDFAIRDWARRSPRIKQVMHSSDTRRLKALQVMFERHGYATLEAVARARILYYMQIGYDDAQLDEPMAARNALVPAYLIGFTGHAPSEAEVSALREYAESIGSAQMAVQSE